MTLKPGARLGNFFVEARIGSGAHSQVYRAWDLALRREVAIKVLRNDHHQMTPQAFYEAQIIAALDHPHILKVHSVEARGNAAYLVMEFVDGGSLNERASARQLQTGEIVTLAISLADTLGHAHKHGVIHRDVKPSNILMTSSSSAKLADFGLATTVGGATVGRVGTPHYMPPELWMGGPATTRSDLYSLAASLVYAATGAPLFPNIEEMEVLRAAHLHQPVRLRDDIPRKLREILEACLEKSPADRPASAYELIPALAALAGRRSSDCATAGDRTEPASAHGNALDPRDEPTGAPHAVWHVVRVNAMREAALTSILALPHVELFRASILQLLADAHPLIGIVGLADSALASLVSHAAAMCRTRITWRSTSITEHAPIVAQIAALVGAPSGAEPDQVIDACAPPGEQIGQAASSSFAIHVQLQRNLAPGEAIDIQRMARRAIRKGVTLVIEAGSRRYDPDVIAVGDGFPESCLMELGTNPTTGRSYAEALLASIGQRWRWTDDAVTLASVRGQHLGDLELLIASACNVATLTSGLVTTWCVEAAFRHPRWIGTIDGLGPEWRIRPQTWPTQEILDMVRTVRSSGEREGKGEGAEANANPG